MPSTRGRRAVAAPAAVPTTPLRDHRIAFSGKFPGHSHKDLNTLFTSLGASVTPSVNGRNTHLVCDEKDFLRKAPKVRDAEAAGVSLVRPEWAAEVARLRTNVDPSNYLWPKEQQDQAGDEALEAHSRADGNRKKRSIAVANPNGSDLAEDTDDGPAPKKPRGPVVKLKDEEAEVRQEKDSAKAETIEAKLKELSRGQFLKKKDVIVPIDERCPLQNCAVYIEPRSGMIYDASLNQSSTSNNHNKFYRLQVLIHGSIYKTWTRWGRVGEMGQSAILGDGSLDDAKRHFEKKFKDKSGLAWKDRTKEPKPNKYAFVERSYDDDSDNGEQDVADGVNKERDERDNKPPECTLPQPVQQVMELIFNQNFFTATMTSLNYDADKLPLGTLSKATILRGFQQLQDLASLMDNPTLASSQWDMTVAAATEHLSNTYYSLIPHAFGRHRPPIIDNEALLRKEIELLESLSDMKDASNIMKIDRSKARTVHPMDSHFQSLGMEEMTPLDHSSSEFDHLRSYLDGSKGSTHGINYKVFNIFRIRRAGESERFNDSEFTKIPSDRRLLWHGSRCANFGGILSQGLRIAPPEAPVSGYMFGKGIYLADMSSKSANYCCSYISNAHALLLLCEAELGDPLQKLTDASYTAGEDAKKSGMYSTWGMGSTGPNSWVDAATVHDSLRGVKMPDTKIAPGPTNIQGAYLVYNEYICYDVAQVKLRYLFHVEM
ncbi:poly polymerase 2 ADP-ribosyltransferase 2 [Metarhizium album ARSEF 1941]|uniref:Poly [ADP-ribose] polymerase n=1 Tax=Metarhizium album (strain ARSEF 1941) TaxID=1081103 RepID=A0A0B2WRN2_METAS|nr:poly polymerase 2 ADP-ribosyltransferase 2 [Metarhizium album ARSEF 1941]KHN95645.1 poly polymerase 2 ADP-ribosyltransferase 2 [Metarhizium album ARSEF 1941]